MTTTAPTPKATCSTCAHWECPTTETDNRDYYHWKDILRPTDPDTYEPMVTPFEVGRCTHPRLLFCERPLERNGFTVADASEYMACLCTGPDFGCVRHTPVIP
jgi:hypothetical protein